MKIHERATRIAESYRRHEAPLIEALQAVEQNRVDRHLGETSMIQYCVKQLKLTEAVGFAFINVARKSREVPELLESIRRDKMTVNKANRLCRALTKENAPDLIAFAEKASVRELDAKVAELNPGKGKRTSTRNVDKETVRLSLDMKKTAMEKFERAKSLMTKNKDLTDGEVLDAALDLWLERNDPVRKAERAKNTTPAKTNPTGKRERIPQATLHAVHLRDRGQCGYRDQEGRRCTNTKYVQIHHVQPVSARGTNDLDNLQTLCTAHHDYVHERMNTGATSLGNSRTSDPNEDRRFQ